MKKKEALYALHITKLLFQVLVYGIFLLFLLSKINAKEAVSKNFRPTNLKQYFPQKSHYALGFLNSNFQFKQKNPVYVRQASMPSEDIFRIEAADAIDVIKYSQPDYSLLNLYSGMKVPSSTFSKHKLFQAPQTPSLSNFQKEYYPMFLASGKDSLKPMQDIRYLGSVDSRKSSSDVINEKSSDKLENTNFRNIFETYNNDNKTTSLYHTKTNFTDISDNLVSISSDTVASYEIPVTEFNEGIENSSLQQDTDIVIKVSHDYADPDISIISSESNSMLPKLTTQSSVQLNTIYDYVNHTNLTSNIMSTNIIPSIISDENVTNPLPSTDSEKKLSSETVAGIVITVLVCVTLLSSAVIYLLYRKFNGKCTSVVESKLNSDNCGYLDDSLHSSIYLNNHIELPKESSEEMTSLDNDSFLNSLETMTIQNYWADNLKNTKV